jgi:hypothetical protein
MGAVGALGASGLILGGVGVPVSAGDVNAGANLQASADVRGGCLTAVVGTGGADGSVHPQQDTTSQLETAVQGTATVSMCPDDSGGTPPEGPGGSVPGELDEIVPGDLGGSVADDLVGVIAGALESGAPGDGDGSAPGDPEGGLPGDLDGVVPGEPGGGDPGDPSGAVPGGLGDALPGGLGGLVPAGVGLARGILDRLPMVVPGIDVGEPGGNDGDGPAINTSAVGTTSGSVAVGSTDAERGAPTGQVPGGPNDRVGPGAIGTDSSPGAALPRTGGGLGTGVLRLIAVLGFGRAAFGLLNRRQRAGHNLV